MESWVVTPERRSEKRESASTVGDEREFRNDNGRPQARDRPLSFLGCGGTFATCRIAGKPSKRARCKRAATPFSDTLLLPRNHVDPAPLAVERHDASDQREQRVVLAPSDVAAGVELRAALANEDAAGRH